VTRLQRCLTSIVRNDYPRDLIEIIVVDNESNDGSAAAARGFGAVIIKSPGDSVAAHRNRGARAALGSIIAFADSDHEIDRNWIQTAVEVLSDPTVAATGSAYLTQPSPNWVQQQYDGMRSRPATREDVTWLGSGNFAVKRAAFERIGGYNAKLTACEDVDLCNRLRLAGQRIVADPNLRSVHFGDPRTLKALFYGELWRGRDNLRVTFSGPRTFRHLRSALIPIATVHGWTGHSNRERYCYYPADKRVLARFPRLIAVSSDIARELIEHGADPERVTTVLNAIDHRQFVRNPARVDEMRASLGLAPNHIAIGAVGRLEPQKRFDLLLEAFAVVHARKPETRLIIAGDGSLNKALTEQRNALGLQDSVIMTGHVTDVIGLHHAFDLFVQSSDYEGTPNSVLEAMAMETPIVATEAGGTAELVHDGEHGRIIPIGKVDRLIFGMEDALTDRTTTRKMADRARIRVQGDLSFEARVRRVEGIYSEVMAPLTSLREAHA
jgi:glycosyltransferase involved in cell wall biosynthesis